MEKKRTLKSISSDTSELLFPILVARCGRLSVALKKDWGELAAAVTNHIPTLHQPTYIVFIGILQAISVCLKTHWRASIQSVTATEDTWLSCIQSSCSYLALAAWAGICTGHAYDCITASRFNIPMFALNLILGLHCIVLVVPFTALNRNRFATFVFVLISAVLEGARRVCV